MTLFRNRKPVADDWRTVADDSPVPESAKVVISLRRWRAERATLTPER